MPRRHLNRKFIHRASLVFSLLMLVLAVITLHESLEDYTYGEIVHELGGIPRSRLFLSVLLTAVSYALMTFYDKLALDYLGARLKFRRIAVSSFISYAIGNNVGQALLSGGALRLRMYSSYGLSPLQIAKIIGFTVFTFWIGFLALAGSAFFLDPLAIPVESVLYFDSSRPVGLIFIVGVAGYLAFAAMRRRDIRLFGHPMPPPEFKIALAQVVVSAFDMVLSCAAFYMLLPAHPGLTFIHFLGIYMLAMLLGLVSMVPGGLGVFETILVLLLKPYLSSSVLLGALIAYRLIYYLLPLAVAALGLVVFESRAIQREGLFGWFRHMRSDSHVVEEAADALLDSAADVEPFDIHPSPEPEAVGAEKIPLHSTDP